jgi:SagB-type dehydrogenase family enzyme
MDLRVVVSLREPVAIEGSPAVVAALARLAAEGAPEDEIAGDVLRAEGPVALARLHHRLGRLAARGLVRRTLRWDGAPIATVDPSLAAPDEVDPEQRFRLSRFAIARREGDGIVVESPLSAAAVTLHDRRAGALWVDLAAPASAQDLADRLPVAVGAVLLGLLRAAGLIEPESTAESPALAPWEVHDLLLHARSRRLGRPRPYGPTYRLAGRMAPLPAIAPCPDGGLPLFRPDLASLLRDDVPFTRVVEERRSIREQGETPITAAALGELLYRAARVRRRFAGDHEELSDRPYPGGGALYELEIHPVVRRCAGLDAGLYRYDPDAHRLHRARGADREVEALLDDARAAAGVADVQVLLVLAARFARVAYKYESMAYALVLKDAGVLLQTMCLVATAMGLAACPLGGGDAAAFARAAGVDPLAEPSVGEIILGSPAGAR